MLLDNTNQKHMKKWNQILAISGFLTIIFACFLPISAVANSDPLLHAEYGDLLKDVLKKRTKDLCGDPLLIADIHRFSVYLTEDGEKNNIIKMGVKAKSRQANISSQELVRQVLMGDRGEIRKATIELSSGKVRMPPSLPPHPDYNDTVGKQRVMAKVPNSFVPSPRECARLNIKQ